MVEPLISTADLVPPPHPTRRAVVPVFERALATGLVVFGSTWLFLAWPTVVMNLKWAAHIPLSADRVDDTVATIPRNHLVIPSLGVDAPLVFDVPTTDAVGRLPDGVVHLAGTPRPGQAGTSVLAGHSAGYWWQRGDYNQVFALLDKLTVGAELFVNVDGTTSRFRMTGRQVVRPTEVDVLARSTAEPTLVLLTCTPVGTTRNRLLVEATLVVD